MYNVIEFRKNEPKESILKKLDRVLKSVMEQLVNCESLEDIRNLEDWLDQLFLQIKSLKNCNSEICELMSIAITLVRDTSKCFDDLQTLKKLKEIPYCERIPKASEILKKHTKANAVIYKTAKYVLLHSLLLCGIFDEHINTEKIRAELSTL